MKNQNRFSVIETPQNNGGRVPFAALEPRLSALLEGGDDGVIRFMDLVLEQALWHRASDVHVEPWDDCIMVRYRIDGLLHEAARFPRQYLQRVTGRIKVLARMPSYLKETPQDGRILPESTPCGKPMRVSAFPTVLGEKVVIRVLDADPGLFSLDALGFPEDTVATLRAAISRPQGALLLTGPASSGKTTTIYAMLTELLELRAPSVHAVTIEDPVEHRLGRVAQTEVNPQAGFTFEAALRSVLRQDPEVIMLGEIRDPETARAAIQAGLTGHLVISTIHSAGAAGVFTRLLDMGVEPYLLSSAVTSVLAQRLLRRNCPECAEAYAPDPAQLRRFGLDPEGNEYRRGAGCDACEHIGYHGRTAAGELLVVDDAMGEFLLNRPRTTDIHHAAVAAGMRPLARDAALRVAEGVTTIEEAARVLPPPQAEGTRPARHDRDGFGLIELVGALFVIAVGLLGTVTLFHFGVGQIGYVRECSVVRQAMQDEIETLRAKPFDQLIDQEAGPFTEAPFGLENVVNAQSTLSIRPDADGIPGLKEVEVAIRWTTSGGRTVDKRIATCIAEKRP